jgi:hypothetical protein
VVSIIIRVVIKDAAAVIMARLVKRLTVLKKLTTSLEISVGRPTPTGCRQILAFVATAINFTLTKNQLPETLFFPPHASGFHA